MKQWRFLNHTADIKVQVCSDTMAGLFQVSLDAMNYILFHEASCNSPKQNINEEIEISSVDETSLLIDFLSDVLTLSYNLKICYSSVTFHRLTVNELNARINGIPILHFYEDIKAVTYHEAEVVQNDSGHWCTPIVFDI